ncbi:hypothetical protein CDV31_006285 [Fusarium ambrosium]|uniref:Uncharacterized protein n=1 Tax=Fusarium ambrosium TaxID=131363 RepID=A0A428UDT1_9HYPO|nr:hypothetical protein CDV31_006285 [Fusarium ambrosium]
MLQPTHQMHHEARQRVDPQNEHRYTLSEVLYQIGEIVGEMPVLMTSTANCTVYKGHEVYCVIGQDVKVVTMAIDRAAWGALRRVDRTYKLFQEALESLDNDPPDGAVCNGVTTTVPGDGSYLEGVRQGTTAKEARKMVLGGVY